MSYTRPPYDQADASWQLQAPYIRPAHDAADAQWEPEDVTYASASGVISLLGQAKIWYQDDISAAGLLPLNGFAEMVERTGASAHGRLALSGSARASLLAYVSAAGNIALGGDAAASWYVPTPFIGGANASSRVISSAVLMRMLFSPYSSCLGKFSSTAARLVVGHEWAAQASASVSSSDVSAIVIRTISAAGQGTVWSTNPRLTGVVSAVPWAFILRHNRPTGASYGRIAPPRSGRYSYGRIAPPRSGRYG